MNKPLLQLALDHTNLTSALQSAEQLKNDVDIIEAGTILCLSEGINAVTTLRRTFSNSTIVADFKMADAGETLAQQAFNSGANWLTVICAAPLATIEKAHEVALQHQGEIQIELFGHWTINDVKAWRKIGIKQAIYHRGRDAQASGQTWHKQDLDAMQYLADMGIELSITGGITPQDLHLFKSLPVKAFIAGRALYASANPQESALQFRHAIEKIWG